MFNINQYNVDGANWQAQAVACYIKGHVYGLEVLSWNSKYQQSNVTVEIGRYENCREQGYIIRMRHNWDINVCYAVYEHRNSDQLVCCKFHVCCVNTPTVDDVWKDRDGKYDVDFSVGYGEISKMGDWILNDMEKELGEYLED